MPVFLTKEYSYGSCTCCGGDSTVSQGKVSTHDQPEVSYWVRWSEAHPEHPMLFVVNLPDSEKSVASLYFLEKGSFTVIGPDRPLIDLDMLDHLLKREDVIGTPLAGQIFAYLDEIYLHDVGVSSFISSQEALASTQSPPRLIWVAVFLASAIILYLVLR